MANEITPTTATRTAVAIWAHAKTGSDSLNRRHLVARKIVTVNGFFNYVNMHPLKVQPADVLRWQQSLEERELAHTTIYAMLCHLSSFYAWLGAQVGREHNPVEAVRPKPPKPYQGPTVKALSEGQARSLLAVVRTKADAGDVVAMRDFALLVFYFETGMRRNEVMRLNWGDIQMDERGDAITTRTKGGEVVTQEIADERVWRALFDYLEASGRLETIGDADPLWARHDAAADGLHDLLSSRGFAGNLKAYAQEAGIPDMHLHRTRHTFARRVAEMDGVAAAQEALGHKKQETTRIYTGRLLRKRDRHGPKILDDLL